MAKLEAGAGHGAHWAVSLCSRGLGRDLGGLGSAQPGLRKDTPPMQGCPPLPWAWPFPKSRGDLTGVTYGVQGDCPVATQRGHMSIP